MAVKRLKRVFTRYIRAMGGVLVFSCWCGLLEGEVEELKRREAELGGGLGYGLPEPSP